MSLELRNALQDSGNVMLVAGMPAIGESGCRIKRFSSDWRRSLLQQVRACQHISRLQPDRRIMRKRIQVSQYLSTQKPIAHDRPSTRHVSSGQSCHFVAANTFLRHVCPARRCVSMRNVGQRNGSTRGTVCIQIKGQPQTCTGRQKRHAR